MIDEADFRTPGQLLAALLKERGWTQRVLAIVLELDEARVNKVVTDKRSVDAELAVALEDVFAVPAERFLQLQAEFDLARARITSRPDPRRARRAALYGGLPVNEMIKRGWLEAKDIRDLAKVEKELCRFFEVDEVDQIEVLPHAAKKTEVSAQATPAQLAWLYRVRQIASEMLVARYSAAALTKAIVQLQTLVRSAEEVRKVPRILAESGVRFAIVESLPGAKIDGACFWLDPQSPVVGMSLRHDRIDNFWFVLRHELEHVLQSHGQDRIILDIELEGERAGQNAVELEERVANLAASEFCVPKKALDAFVARKAPFFSDVDLRGFAATLQVHPGLVAGQLQHRTGRYNLFRDHLVKVRSLIASSALVDGWGDVAPVGH